MNVTDDMLTSLQTSKPMTSPQLPLTSPAPTLTSAPSGTLGWDQLYWTPYVALVVILLVLACASFLQYHRKHRGKYEDAEYKRKNNIDTAPRKHRVTLNRKGRVVCLTQPHLTTNVTSQVDMKHSNGTPQKDIPVSHGNGLNGIAPITDIFTVGREKETTLRQDTKQRQNPKGRQMFVQSGDNRFVGDSTSSNDDSGVVMDVVPKRTRDRVYGNPPAGSPSDNYDITGQMSDVTVLYKRDKGASSGYINRAGSFTAENGLCMQPAGAHMTSELRHHRGDLYAMGDSEEPV